MPPENAALADALLDAAMRGDWDAVELLERVSGPDAKPAPAQPARRSARYLKLRKRIERRFARLEELLRYGSWVEKGMGPRSAAKGGGMVPIWKWEDPGSALDGKTTKQITPPTKPPGSGRGSAAPAAGSAPVQQQPAQQPQAQGQEAAPGGQGASAAPAPAKAPHPGTTAAKGRQAEYERLKGALGSIGKSKVDIPFAQESIKAIEGLNKGQILGLAQHLGIAPEKIKSGAKSEMARDTFDKAFGAVAAARASGDEATFKEALKGLMPPPAAPAGEAAPAPAPEAAPAQPAAPAAAPAPAAETLSSPAPAPQPAPAPSSPAPSSPSASPSAPHPLATAAEALRGFLGGKHGLDQAGVAAFERAISELGRAAGGGEAPKASPAAAKAEAPKPPAAAAPAPATAASPPAPAAEAPVAPPPSAAIPRAPAAEVPPPAPAPAAQPKAAPAALRPPWESLPSPEAPAPAPKPPAETLSATEAPKPAPAAQAQAPASPAAAPERPKPAPAAAPAPKPAAKPAPAKAKAKASAASAPAATSGRGTIQSRVQQAQGGGGLPREDLLEALAALRSGKGAGGRFADHLAAATGFDVSKLFFGGAEARQELARHVEGLAFRAGAEQPKAAPAPAQNDIPPASPAVAAPKPAAVPKPPAKAAAASKPAAPATQAAPPPPGLDHARPGPVAPKPLPPEPPAERPKADLVSDLRRPDGSGRVIPEHVPAKPAAPAPAAPGGMDALASRLEAAAGDTLHIPDLFDSLPEAIRPRLSEALFRLWDDGAIQMSRDFDITHFDAATRAKLPVDPEGGHAFTTLAVTDPGKVRAALAALAQPAAAPAAPAPAAPAKPALSPEEHRRRLKEDRAKRKAASVIDIPAPKPAPAGAAALAAKESARVRAEAEAAKAAGQQPVPRDQALSGGLAKLLGGGWAGEKPAAAKATPPGFGQPLPGVLDAVIGDASLSPGKAGEAAWERLQGRTLEELSSAYESLAGRHEDHDTAEEVMAGKRRKADADDLAKDKREEGDAEDDETLPARRLARAIASLVRSDRAASLLPPDDKSKPAQVDASWPRSVGKAKVARAGKELALPTDFAVDLIEEAGRLEKAGKASPEMLAVRDALRKGQAPSDAEKSYAGRTFVLMPPGARDAFRELGASLDERLPGGMSDDLVDATDAVENFYAGQPAAAPPPPKPERVSKPKAAPASAGPPGTVPITLTGASSKNGTLTNTLKNLSAPDGDLHRAIMAADPNGADARNKTGYLTPAAEAELRKILSGDVAFGPRTEKLVAKWRPAKQDAPAPGQGGRAEPILEPPPAPAAMPASGPAAPDALPAGLADKLGHERAQELRQAMGAIPKADERYVEARLQKLQDDFEAGREDAGTEHEMEALDARYAAILAARSAAEVPAEQALPALRRAVRHDEADGEWAAPLSREMESVFQGMPAGVLSRAAKGLSGVTYKRTRQEVHDSVMAESRSHARSAAPEVLARMAERFVAEGIWDAAAKAAFDAAAPAQKAEMAAEGHAARIDVAMRGRQYGGGYDPSTGVITVNGAEGLESSYGGGSAARFMPAPGEVRRHLYFHEFFHAVSGKGLKLCSAPEWKAAWEADIARYQRGWPLTRYAASNQHEGFAEFGRALYASGAPPEEIRAAFPKAAAYFESQGLWPGSDPAKGKAGQGGKAEPILEPPPGPSSPLAVAEPARDRLPEMAELYDVRDELEAKEAAGPIDAGDREFLRGLRDQIGAREWMAGAFDPSSFSAAESMAASKYSGSEHKMVNEALRGKAQPQGWQKEQAERTVASLDAVASRTRLPEAKPAWRGLDPRKGMQRLAPGDTVRDPAYMSASLRRMIAEGFAGNGGDLLEIVLPAGQGVVPVSAMSGGNRSEAELLLPRGTALRIVSEEPRGRGRLLKAEIVQEAKDG